MTQPTDRHTGEDAKSETATLHVRVAKDLDRALEIKAAEVDKPKRQLVEDALRLYLGIEAA